MSFSVLYLDDAYVNEEDALRNGGVSTCRSESGQIERKTVSGLSGKSVLVRGPRLADDVMVGIERHLQTHGLQPVGLGRFRELMKDPQGVARALGDLSPKTISLPASTTVSQFLMAVEEDDVKFPIFVRSERESAAKYVGVEKCIIQTGATAEAEEVLGSLHDNVPDFSWIVVKEVWEIARDEANRPMEYRAILAGNTIVSWDSAIPSELQSVLTESVSVAISRLAGNYADLACFVDFAVSPKGRAFVVESKHLANGTIRSPQAFASGLLSC